MGCCNSKPTVTRLPVMRPFNDGSKYPFKNAIFEGGGAKGTIYVGVVKELQAQKILSQIERVGGASAGALMACMISVGASASQIETVMNETDFKDLLMDGHFGDLTEGGCRFCCTMWNCKENNLYSLFKNYGFFPGEKLQVFLEDLMEKFTGKRQITFMELYQQCGRELCVMVTNLNSSTAEYFHPKTTPTFPVAKAVHMSMSLPFVFASQRVTVNGRESLYCDGGVMLNYPIRAFDGWMLSLKPEDTFFKKWVGFVDAAGGDQQKAMSLGVRSTNAYSPSPETIGFKIYCSHTDEDIAMAWLEANERLVEAYKPADSVPVPDTKLGKAFKKETKNTNSAHNLHVSDKYTKLGQNVEAMAALNKDGKISRADVKAKSPALLPLFDSMDTDKSGVVDFVEFTSYMETHGFPFGELFRGNGHQKITNLLSYINDGLISGLELNQERTVARNGDVLRTVPLDVRYIQTTDFVMEMGDKKFCENVGQLYTRAWLKYWDENLRESWSADHLTQV